MERFRELREKAKNNVKVADHMITMSYPMFRDPKILVSAVKNLYQATDNAVSSMLEYEKLFKRISVFHDSFDVKMNLFKQKLLPFYKLDNKYVKLFSTLQDLVRAHKESAVEFPRNDTFVMCSDTYEMRTISVKELKILVKETKDLVDDAYKVTSKHDRIFK